MLDVEYKTTDSQNVYQDGLSLLEKIAGCVPESVSLEDAKAEYFAEKSNLDYIITRDKKNGFKNSPVKNISLVDFLKIK